MRGERLLPRTSTSIIFEIETDFRKTSNLSGNSGKGPPNHRIVMRAGYAVHQTVRPKGSEQPEEEAGKTQ